MIKKSMFYLLIIIFILSNVSFSQDKKSAEIKFIIPSRSGLYLGEKPPWKEPKIFAPGIISTGMFTRDIAMTPDGKEIYYCVSLGNYAINTILYTKLFDGKWTEPEVASFAENPKQMNLEPCISADGKKFFFVSNRKIVQKGEAGRNTDIYVMDRKGDGWGEPYDLGAPVNSDAPEFFPSVAKNGNIYFTREGSEGSSNIYRSKYIDGKYQEPEKLPEQVNCGKEHFNAFISPDESYIIVCVYGRKDTKGQTDYYIVFRNPDDTWNEPRNMGDKINTAGGNEYSPYVSPDGKYFFFMSSRFEKSMLKDDEKLTYSKLKEINRSPGNGNSCIYWIDSEVIKNLK
jgi:hypothetical protein